ncbi:MAG: lipopolysaccharide biosynthesis protein [Gammaproteobacteria bacterium]
MPHNRKYSMHPNLRNSTLLFLLALAHHGLMYGANIMLARTLGIAEFNDYSVAISTVTILSALATLGLEKYALRAIPVFRERQDWQRYRVFWLFSLRTIAGFSIVLALTLVLSLESILLLYASDYHIAIVVYAGFLPVIAVSLFLVEFIAAHGAVLLSVTIYRFLLPMLYLVILIGVSVSLARMSALIAVGCYGLAWTATGLLMWRLSSYFMPHDLPGSHPSLFGASWLRASLPLVMNSLMMTVMTSSGVVIMELLFPDSKEVGIYAAAAQTGGFLSLIGTSTNRYYLPLMVTLMEHRDKPSIRQLMHQRALIVGGLILSLLMVVYLFGDKVLGLFGPHFKGGHDALVIIAVGAAVSALYADIPYYLQFMGKKRTVFYLTAAATLSMLAFSFIWGAMMGAIGVALAYMVPVVALFTGLRIIAFIHFGRL